MAGACELAKNNRAEHLADAALYAFLSDQHNEAQQILAHLLNDSSHQHSSSLLRILLFSLLQQEQFDEARTVLSRLQQVEPSAPWIKALEQCDWSRLKREMATVAVFRPTILHASAGGASHRLQIMFGIKCNDCGHEFSECLMHSPLRLRLSVCQRCAHPFVLSPKCVSDALQRKTSAHDLLELCAIDNFLWSWVHTWTLDRKLPCEASTKYTENLFALSYFTIRYALGECYAALFDRRKRSRPQL